MAISRAQLVKELEPGLNALFGLEYKNYADEHAEIFDVENSDRAFEEEVMLSGFANASDIVASVFADPYIVYEAQHNGTGTAAMNNSAFDFTGTSGSTLSGQSTSEIDTSSSGTSGGFKQIGISKDPENSDTSSANANSYVVFNTGEHVFKLTTGV